MRHPLRLAVALLSILLGIMLIKFTFDRKDTHEHEGASPTASSEKTLHSGVARDASQKVVASRSGQVDVRQTPEAEHQIGDAVHHSAAQPETQNRTSIDRPPSPVSETSSDPEKMLTTDLSVVGRPFPVSESVVEACQPGRPVRSTPEACGRVNELLAAMAREPRDGAWASAMEEQLRAYAEAQPDKLTIRALECRKTICFIETAAAFPAGLPMPDYAWREERGLAKEYSLDAFESDDAGVRLSITLFPFRRK